MEVNNLFLYSVSVFSILGSVFLVLTGIFLAVFMLRANRIGKSVEKLLQTVNDTVSETGESIKHASNSVEQFAKGLFTLETVKDTVLDIINTIKNKKGDKNEKGK